MALRGQVHGYRCLAGRNGKGVILWSRRGNLFTTQLPHIARACERLPPGTLLDGEIVALDANGWVSFNLLQHHRSKARALLFYVFDVLAYRGRSLLKEPLERRRQVLAEAIKDATTPGKAAPIALSETLNASAADLVRVAREFGFEGVVAKRKDSLYESGKRTGAWVKYKVNRGQEFVIGGYTSENPFDALIAGYYEGRRLLYAAKVRNGFVPKVRREVASRFKGLEIGACPFANLPERKRTQWALTKEMKNCVFAMPNVGAIMPNAALCRMRLGTGIWNGWGGDLHACAPTFVRDSPTFTVGVRSCNDTWGRIKKAMLWRGPYGWNFPTQFIMSHLCSSQFQSFQTLHHFAPFKTSQANAGSKRFKVPSLTAVQSSKVQRSMGTLKGTGYFSPRCDRM
jgi:ATP dependent DNA ligase domain